MIHHTRQTTADAKRVAEHIALELRAIAQDVHDGDISHKDFTVENAFQWRKAERLGLVRLVNAYLRGTLR